MKMILPKWIAAVLLYQIPAIYLGLSLFGIRFCRRSPLNTNQPAHPPDQRNRHFRRRTARTIALSTALVMIAAVSHAQGNFVNLGFESATVVPTLPGQFGGSVSALSAIPGWTAFLGTTQLGEVFQNNLTLGNASIDILGPNWSFGGLIDGQYTVVLQPGLGAGQAVSASISQSGLVPINTSSLQFKAIVSSRFSIALGGQDLPLIPLQAGPNYTLYGANISQFAGHFEMLTITALAGPSGAPSYFDSFVFSPSAVPEPSLIVLFGVGLLLLHSRSKHFQEAPVRRQQVRQVCDTAQGDEAETNGARSSISARNQSNPHHAELELSTKTRQGVSPCYCRILA